MHRKPSSDPPAWTLVRDLPVSRRQALSWLGMAGASMALPGCASRLVRPGDGPDTPPADLPGWAEFEPIDRSLGETVPKAFSGDRPDGPHSIFFDPDRHAALRASAPPPSEHVDLVIVGGGISGLASAYLNRQRKPVLLEQASRFGGVSRGESWRGIDYGIGAAYFMHQEPDSPIGRFYAEIGLDKLYRVKKTEDPVELDGRRYEAFWNGDTSPQDRSQFVTLRDYFVDMLNGKNGRVYPEIPAPDAEHRAYVDGLDRITFKAHLESLVGGALHPHIETALEHYCWSTFGSTFAETSAASGLNEYVAEFDDVYVLPGGNGRIAEELLRRIAAELPRSSLRPSSIVFDVRVDADRVIVSYLDAQGRVSTLSAAQAILGCPKFVAQHIVRDLEPERLAAIGKLRYTSYLVANVLIDQPLADTFYDFYLLGDGRIGSTDIRQVSEKHRVTDVVHGTYARPHPERSVLTLYRGLPYPSGRTDVYADGAFERFRGEFEAQISGSIMPLLGLDPKKIVDLRMARWGHPMPVPARGLIADRVTDAASKPFRGRVHFVHQDNWMLPAIETSLTEALTTAALLRAGS